MVKHLGDGLLEVGGDVIDFKVVALIMQLNQSCEHNVVGVYKWLQQIFHELNFMVCEFVLLDHNQPLVVLIDVPNLI